MLSPGDGIALSGVCALALGALWRRRNNGRSSSTCSEHSGVVANIGELSRDVKDIKVDMKEVRTDIKTLIGRK